ncbi:MAG: PAS domain-containing sensor histidine kinase [Armatimonadota bacterium]
MPSRIGWSKRIWWNVPRLLARICTSRLDGVLPLLPAVLFEPGWSVALPMNSGMPALLAGLLLVTGGLRRAPVEEIIRRLNREIEQRAVERAHKADTVQQNGEIARRQAEETLQATEEYMASIITTIPDGVVVLTHRGLYLYANTMAEQIFGQVCDDIAGRAYNDPAWQMARYDGSSMPDDELPFARVMRTEQPVSDVAYSLLRPDGDRRLLSANAAPLFDRDGELTGVVAVLTDVTDHYRAEEALRVSQEKYRALVENTYDWVWEVDEQILYTYASPCIRDLLGYEPDEVVGRSPFDLMSPEEAARVHAVFDPVARRHEPFSLLENALVHRDGHLVVVETNGSPIFDEAGLFRGYRGVDRDITERKRVEEAFRETVESLQAVVNASPAAIVGVDLEGIVIFWAPSAETMFGWSAAEALGQLLPLVPPEKKEEHLRFRKQAQRGELLMNEEVVCRRKDGSPIEVSLSTAPLRDADGQICGTVVVYIDITECKQAQRVLERERAFLSSAIDILPFPIIFFSPRYEVLLDNKAAQRLNRDFDGEHWRQLRLLAPDTHAELSKQQRPSARALSGEVLPAMEAIAVTPEGREMPLLLHAAPIYLEGQVIAAVVAAQDISELKAADRAKDQFLMTLSHEMKTPLTSIIGWVQAAARMPEAIPQALEVIERNALEQRQLLEELLDVSRIIHGRLYLKPEPLDLWELVQQCVDGFTQAARARGITLAVKPPNGPLPILADPVRIRQIVRNLLDNALKFTDCGGKILVGGYREGQAVQLIVRDTGRGIAPEELHMLFSPFRKAGRAEESGGLGLGLTLVKGIVEAHGGRIQATSRGLGKGSTFTVILPLRKDEG